MDTLKLVSSWSSGELASPIKVSVEGILIQGCKFDGSQLIETEPSDPILAQVPQFQLAWLPEESVNMTGKISLPLYLSASREALVTYLVAPLASSSAVPWILAGVALFIG